MTRELPGDRELKKIFMKIVSPPNEDTEFLYALGCRLVGFFVWVTAFIGLGVIYDFKLALLVFLALTINNLDFISLSELKAFAKPCLFGLVVLWALIILVLVV